MDLLKEALCAFLSLKSLMHHTIAEYIWVDGHKPTPRLRSKAKVLSGPVYQLSDLPDWGFDGSSTEQADGHFSDCRLKPAKMIHDPIRGGNHLIVLCEVFNADGTVHASNTRAYLREVAERFADQEAWFGMEQEHTLYDGEKPLGWPDNGFPRPQGPYYCGVGDDDIAGRALVEDHLQKCLEAGLTVSGINAEVMLGQWEYQIGPVGPLEIGDQIILSRWLLYRLGEDYGVRVSFDPKPVKGDWNGAGMHTNFSTKAMRDAGGIQAIEEACQRLGQFHAQHISVYGAGNEHRLTGLHETCSIDQFRYGISDRGASIRIPMATADAGCGYLEDRRPAGNCDPYLVATALLETVCGGGFHGRQ